MFRADSQEDIQTQSTQSTQRKIGNYPSIHWVPLATRDEVIEALKKVVDPELYIDIWTLGLIYDLKIEDSKLDVRMTFTSIACPAGPQLVQEVKQKTMELPGIEQTNVEVVFQPPWEPSEDLKAMLGIG